MLELGSCTVTNKTKDTPTPVGVPFVLIKNKILGEKYDLSLVILTPQAQKIGRASCRERV